MKLLNVLLVLFPIISMGQTYNVDAKASKIDWHLYIEKDTNVYGEIPVIEGKLDFVGQKGEIKFDLAKTKSWELEDGKKEFSNARDDRIRSITGSEDNIPSFKLVKITGHENKSLVKEVEVQGELKLNGNTKKITVKGSLDGNKLKAQYKIKWKDFDISNPVIWILRATSTPDDFITVNFDLSLK